jgi:hypothetical protein
VLTNRNRRKRWVFEYPTQFPIQMPTLVISKGNSDDHGVQRRHCRRCNVYSELVLLVCMSDSKYSGWTVNGRMEIIWGFLRDSEGLLLQDQIVRGWIAQYTAPEWPMEQSTYINITDAVPMDCRYSRTRDVFPRRLKENVYPTSHKKEIYDLVSIPMYVPWSTESSEKTHIRKPCPPILP